LRRSAETMISCKAAPESTDEDGSAAKAGRAFTAPHRRPAQGSHRKARCAPAAFGPRLAHVGVVISLCMKHPWATIARTVKGSTLLWPEHNRFDQTVASCASHPLLIITSRFGRERCRAVGHGKEDSEGVQVKQGRRRDPGSGVGSSALKCGPVAFRAVNLADVVAHGG
jgi:hypothetical protein